MARTASSPAELARVSSRRCFSPAQLASPSIGVTDNQELALTVQSAADSQNAAFSRNLSYQPIVRTVLIYEAHRSQMLCQLLRLESAVATPGR